MSLLRFVKYSLSGLLLLQFLVLPVVAETLDRVLVAGNRRVEDATIKAQIKTEPGSSYSAEAVAADIKNIYRTGMFEQVTAKLLNEGGKTNLVFVVVEKPAIRKILFEGNEEIKESTLQEKLNLGTKLYLDKKKVAASIEEIRKHYQSEGYYGTTVEYEVTSVQDNQADLTIKVKEGTKKRIRQVVFEGNRKLESGELQDIIKTSRYKWWNSWILGTGYVKEDELTEDVKELSKHYLNNGFVDIQVGSPVIEEIPDGLKVVFKIEEGEIYKLDKIEIGGDLLKESPEETLQGVESKSGEVFSLETLRKDTFTISEKFTDIGYAFANVEPATSVHRAAKTVDLKFVVSKGELIQINRIIITGNKKTNDNVVRRSLKIQEQELFSSSKIRRSQELVQRLGYFDEVTITPESTAEKGTVDLNVSVKEGSTGSFSIGAGISSGEGFIFTSKISENNLFGTGNSLSFDVNTGNRRDSFVLSFNNPRVDDSRLSMGIDLLSTHRKFDTFDRDQAGGSISAGYPLWFLNEEGQDDYRFSLSYDLLSIDIKDVDLNAPALVQEQKGKTSVSSFTPQLIRNTIDNPLDPTKGSKQNLSVELAGAGGNEKYWLGNAANSLYYPLWKSPIGNFVFSQRFRLGYGQTFTGEDFPLFKRFFPGGINSVRGYEYGEMGPKDENGEYYGGNSQLIANFELIFPIVASIGLSGVAFYDAGNAFDDHESIDVNEFRQAVGWGIRWRSPLAPIRVEFGYPLDPEEGDSSFVTNFSLGTPP